MTINRNNYEVFIIDYYDGKLTPVESAELLFFLSQNPDLEEAFNLFEHINLATEIPHYKEKNLLHKNFSDIESITETNFEEFCIAFAEGDLDKKSEKKIITYLDENPDKNNDFKLYQKVHLKPDLSVRFPGKNLLKRQKPVLFMVTRPLFYLGAAAAVIIVILLTNISEKQRRPVLTFHEQSEPAVNETGKTGTGSKKPDEEFDVAIDTENKIPVETVIYNTPEKHTVNKTGIPENRLLLNNEYLAINPIEVNRIENSINPAPITATVKAAIVSNENIPDISEGKTLKNFISDNLISRENFDLWTLAEASVKGINYLTESEVTIAKKMNADGKISGIAIDSESFGISTPLNK